MHMTCLMKQLDLSELLAYEGEGGGTGEGQTAAIISDEALKVVTKLVDDRLNGALANLRKKDIPNAIKEGLAPFTGQLSEIQTSLASLTQRNGDGSGGEGGEGKPGADKIPPAVAADLKRLKEDAAKRDKLVEELVVGKRQAEELAAATALDAATREALVGLNFVNEPAAQTAFQLLKPKLVKADDGTFVAGDLPVKDFVKDFFGKDHAYLLKSDQRGGSGAGTGSANNQSRSVGLLDIDKIKPGMSKEDEARAANEISAVLAAQRS